MPNGQTSEPNGGPRREHLDMTTPQTRRSGFTGLVELAGLPFFPLAFFARLPLAMLTIGTMTMVSTGSGSYAAGGLAAGLVGIGSALGAPAIGHLADRRGQRPVLTVAAAVHGAAVASLLLAAGRAGGGEPGWGLALLCLAAGASSPQIGPFARVRWQYLTAGRPGRRRELDSAMSYESTADELSFVLGPALVGLLAAAVAPWLPLALGAAATMVLVPLFAAHPSGAGTTTAGTTTAGPHGAPDGDRKAVWTRQIAARLGVVFAGMVAMGTVFGSTAAGTVAFAGLHGDAASGGLLYAGMGLTSAVAALSVAFWSPRWPHEARWIGCAALVLLGSLLLQVPADLPGIVAALLVFGAPVGPLMVTVFALAGKVAPAGRMGTVMSLMASGNVIGTSLGQALAGVLSDAFGHRGSYAVATGAAVVLVLAGILAAVLDGRSRDRDAAAAAVPALR